MAHFMCNSNFLVTFPLEDHQAFYIEKIMHVMTALVKLLTDINSCVRIITLLLSLAIK